jgi:hypothetical protein
MKGLILPNNLQEILGLFIAFLIHTNMFKKYNSLILNDFNMLKSIFLN